MAEIPQCPAKADSLMYDLTCTMVADHKGLHVDPGGILWAANDREGYRRAAEMR